MIASAMVTTNPTLTLPCEGREQFLPLAGGARWGLVVTCNIR